jgi:hypothetical protein
VGGPPLLASHCVALLWTSRGAAEERAPGPGRAPRSGEWPATGEAVQSRSRAAGLSLPGAAGIHPRSSEGSETRRGREEDRSSSAGELPIRIHQGSSGEGGLSGSLREEERGGDGEETGGSEGRTSTELESWPERWGF